MIIVFAGLIGNCGSGGQAWAYMQYLAGLKRAYPVNAETHYM